MIFALSATLDGQITVDYVKDQIEDQGLEVQTTRLAQGVPHGGELDHLDEGTLAAAMRSRR